MALEYFPCYYSYRKKIAKLSDQEVGRLFRHLLEYGETGETEELTGREAVAFDFIADDIDRAKKAYDDRCNTNRKNVEKRYDRIQSNTTVDLEYETYQTETKDKDKDKDKTEDKGKDEYVGNTVAAKPTRPRFAPPSVEDVSAYCEERGNNVDPQHFVDYYTANGWTQGKGKPVKDWKACVRTWESNGITRNRTGSRRILTAAEAANAPATYIDMSDLDKLIGRI